MNTLKAFIAVLIFCTSSYSIGNSIEDKLKVAIETNNIVRVNVLLRTVEDINSIRLDGLTAVQYARKQEQMEIVNFLVRNGAEDTPLVVNWGNAIVSVAGVKNAIQIGGNPNDLLRGLPLIHYAAQRSRVSVTRELIRSGANPNKKNSFGHTVLHQFALLKNRLGIEMAINMGVDPNLKDEKGYTYRTYLAGSSEGQNLLASMGIGMPSGDALIRATEEAVKNKDSIALRNILLLSNGQHSVDIDPRLLSNDNIRSAIVLHKYGNVTADKFLKGTDFYTEVSKNYLSGYYLVAMGYIPEPKSEKDLQNMAKICEKHDMMPFLAAAGINTEYSLAALEYHTLFNFIVENCLADQDMSLNLISAMEELSEIIIADDQILAGYLPGKWRSTDSEITYEFNDDNTFSHTYLSDSKRNTVTGTWEIVPAGIELSVNQTGLKEFLMITSISDTESKGDFGWGKFELVR